ncbi:MAG TPA: DUF2934 domain-containing protein [Povalibacter sp.]
MASRTQPSKSTRAPQSTAVPQTIERDEPVVTEIRLLGSLHPLPSREERIAIAAYWRAAQRQFAPGHELDDWLKAEQEIDHAPDGPGR